MLVCPECDNSSLKITYSAELGPSEFDDDHRFQLIKCTSCGLVACAEYRESNRGSFSRDSFTHSGRKISKKAYIWARILSFVNLPHMAMKRSGKSAQELGSESFLIKYRNRIAEKPYLDPDEYENVHYMKDIADLIKPLRLNHLVKPDLALKELEHQAKTVTSYKEALKNYPKEQIEPLGFAYTYLNIFRYYNATMRNDMLFGSNDKEMLTLVGILMMIDFEKTNEKAFELISQDHKENIWSLKMIEGFYANSKLPDLFDKNGKYQQRPTPFNQHGVCINTLRLAFEPLINAMRDPIGEAKPIMQSLDHVADAPNT